MCFNCFRSISSRRLKILTLTLYLCRSQHRLYLLPHSGSPRPHVLAWIRCRPAVPPKGHCKSWCSSCTVSTLTSWPSISALQRGSPRSSLYALRLWSCLEDLRPHRPAVNPVLPRERGYADAVRTGGSYSVHFLIRETCSRSYLRLRRCTDQRIVRLSGRVGNPVDTLIPRGIKPLNPWPPVPAALHYFYKCNVSGLCLG